MTACINRWVLLATLAAAQAATVGLQAHAQPLDRMPESVPYALADALMPYAQRDYGRALALLAPLAEQGNAVAQLKLGIIFSRGKAGSPTMWPRWDGSPRRPSRARLKLNSSSDGFIATAWERA